jgi:crotonobetainyl-CoA:carnitine CoA-transferase CaiB-like acyl-CoA transferase
MTTAADGSSAGPVPRQEAGHLPGMLEGLRVVEVADETAEYVGLVLAGLGAEVVKVEPPQGAPTRRIGPFLGDEAGPERSLHFWAHNRGKRSVVLDLAAPEDVARFRRLLDSADILLDASGGAVARALGTAPAGLAALLPRRVVARMTPFGDTGPWKDFKASDLVHLALGGVMMNCGYDPDPAGRYDMPPVAPQLWHAYHIAGDQMAVGILAALVHRLHTGEGQDLCLAIHEAVSKNTELDVMSWVMRRAPLYRQTCRHAIETPTHVPTIGHTKDGRWYIATGVSVRDQTNLVPFLAGYGMQADLELPGAGADTRARNVPGSGASDEGKAHILEIVQRFIRAFRYDTTPWREAQAAGLLWAPLRKPHENVGDAHWRARGSFAEVEHPEQGRSFHYPVSRWLSTATAWKAGRRAPLLGEDTEAVLAATPGPRPPLTQPARPRPAGLAKVSPRGRPFPLQGVRIFDFSWFLASAGGTRFAAALGAEVIKVEWKDNPDTRLAAMAPVGGREARRAATAPLKGVTDPDMGGQFNNKNAGKSGLSLNIRHPKGLEIARRLVALSDVVAEGFSPGVLQRLGLGYDVQRALRPDIIYVQQSGMGGVGTYGRFRTIGPVAAAFAGTSEMSGLPEPAMPAGWGYSFLDWIGAYSFASAIIGALYHRDRTGQGQWIDSSQCESGIFLKAVPVLDWSANGRAWGRIGNRSPHKPAAPHGAYRCAGEDRWIAIAAFEEAEWRALARTAGRAEWLEDPRFATLKARLLHQDALDAAVTGWTLGQDAHACMGALQRAGVPAGVCQTAEDRCDRDPQLAALGWLTEVTGTRIGRWPVTEIPTRLAATPPYSGGVIDRGAPCYGEDNARILGELLGYSPAQVAALTEEDVI